MNMVLKVCKKSSTRIKGNKSLNIFNHLTISANEMHHVPQPSAMWRRVFLPAVWWTHTSCDVTQLCIHLSAKTLIWQTNTMSRHLLTRFTNNFFLMFSIFMWKHHTSLLYYWNIGVFFFYKQLHLCTLVIFFAGL